MPTVCTNLLSAYYVHMGYGNVSIVVLSIAILYWIMSVVIMYWIKLQERIAQSIHASEHAMDMEKNDDSAGDGHHDNNQHNSSSNKSCDNDTVNSGGSGHRGSNITAKSVIFPIFVDVMWTNSFLNFTVGVLLLTIEDPDTYAHPSLKSTVVYSVIWGLQHFLIEGVAFLLLQKGLGLNSALKAIKWGMLWGALTGWMKYSTYYYTTRAANGYRLSWELVLIVFYLLVWVFPQRHFYRRPAAVLYGKCWFIFRLVSVLSAVSLTSNESRSVGSCVYIYAPMLIFSILQPYITYYTLLLDSWWWQGMLEHPEDNNNNSSNGSGAGVNNDEDGSGAKWGTILSPMQGLNMNLHSAQSLAVTLDMLKNKAENAVKLLNFAYIKLDTDKLLGQGSFSKVYRGRYKQQECAIKLIFTVDLTVDVINRVAAESQILSSLRSVNVVNILGVAVLPPSMCILLEMCAYGSLADCVKGRKEGGRWTYKPLHLSPIDLYYLALGCTRGLKAIHQLGSGGGGNTGGSATASTASLSSAARSVAANGAAKRVQFCHRDIKSLNFLVDSQLNAKVADLELGQENNDQRDIKEWGGSSGDGLAVNTINYGELFPILHRTYTISALSVRMVKQYMCACVGGENYHSRRGGNGFFDGASERSSLDDIEQGGRSSLHYVNSGGIRLSTHSHNLSQSQRSHHNYHGDSNSSSHSHSYDYNGDDHSIGQRSKQSVQSLSQVSVQSAVHLPTDNGILPNWDPPESMLDRSKYTQKSDIYSFGLVLWELYSREIPFEKGELVSLPRPLPSSINSKHKNKKDQSAAAAAATATTISANHNPNPNATEHQQLHYYSTGAVPPGLLKREMVTKLVLKGYRPNLSTERMPSDGDGVDGTSNNPQQQSDNPMHTTALTIANATADVNANADVNAAAAAAAAADAFAGALTGTQHYGACDQYGQYTYNIPYKLRLLIAQCWSPEPSERPSLNRIIHCLEQLLAGACYTHISPVIELPSVFASVSIPNMLTSLNNNNNNNNSNNNVIINGINSVINNSGGIRSSSIGSSIVGSLSSSFSNRSLIVDNSGGASAATTRPMSMPVIPSSGSVSNSSRNYIPSPEQLFAQLFGGKSLENSQHLASAVSSEKFSGFSLENLWAPLDIECASSSSTAATRHNLSYCVISNQSPFHVLRASDQWYHEFGYSAGDIGGANGLKLQDLFTKISPQSPIILEALLHKPTLVPVLGSIRPSSPFSEEDISPPAVSRKAPPLSHEQQLYLKQFLATLVKGKSDHMVMPISNTAVGPSQNYSIFSYPLQLKVRLGGYGGQGSSSSSFGNSGSGNVSVSASRAVSASATEVVVADSGVVKTADDTGDSGGVSGGIGISVVPDDGCVDLDCFPICEEEEEEEHEEDEDEDEDVRATDITTASTSASASATATADGSTDTRRTKEATPVFREGRFNSNTDDPLFNFRQSYNTISRNTPTPSPSPSQHSSSAAATPQSQSSFSQSYILNHAFGWLQQRARSLSRSSNSNSRNSNSDSHQQQHQQQQQSWDNRTTSTSGNRGTTISHTTTDSIFSSFGGGIGAFGGSGTDSLHLYNNSTITTTTSSTAGGAAAGASHHFRFSRRTGTGTSTNDFYVNSNKSTSAGRVVGGGGSVCTFDTVFVLYFHQVDEKY